MSNSNHLDSISQMNEDDRSTMGRFIDACISAAITSSINQRENRLLRALGRSVIKKTSVINEAGNDKNINIEGIIND